MTPASESTAPTSEEEVTTPEACGGCGRCFFASWTTCMYCGWDPDAPPVAPVRAVPEETFRGGATLGPFVFTALTLGPLAAFLINAALRLGAVPDTDVNVGVLWASAGVCLLLGPIMFTLQLWRRHHGTVHLTASGIEHGGVLLRWEDIESVRFRPGLLRGHSNQSMRDVLSDAFDNLFGVLFSRLTILMSMFVMVFFAVASLVALLTPWHERVVLRLTRGETLVLRDIEDGARLALTAMGYLVGPSAVENP